MKHYLYNKTIGDDILENAVALEHKLWNREDYSEEDIPLFSNIMDFIMENKESFIKYFNGAE